MAVRGGDGGGGRTQLLAAVETLAMTVFTGSSPVFPIPLCFLFFFPSVLLLSLSCFLFFFLSRFSPLYPYYASLLFLSISLCFFISFFLLVFRSLHCLFLFSLSFPFFGPFFALSSPVFIGKTREREVGAATMQPPQKQPEGHVPSFFHRLVVGHGSEVIQVGL